MNTSSPEQSGPIEDRQSNPEVEKPEVLIPSDEIYGVLKGFDGEPLTRDTVWSIDQRRDPVKSFSVEAKDGRYTTFTPGSEHPGMTWGKVMKITTDALLTLSRCVATGRETKNPKSVGYKEKQAKMRERILEVTALANENGPANEEEMTRTYSHAEDEYRKFISSDINGEAFDETEVNESLKNILAITTQLMAKNPLGEVSA